MKTVSVSTLAISQALRYSTLRAQAELAKAQKEANTWAVADVGLALGARTGRAVSFTRDLDRLEGIVDTNGLASSRLSATQAALADIGTASQSFMTTLMSATNGDVSPELMLTTAQGMLKSLTATLNTSFAGEYIFAGVNTDVKPIADFEADGSPNKAAFDAAFLAHFTFTQDDPQAANITGAEMNDFLATVVEPQFLGAGWDATWSSATDEGITSRIALNETLQTSVSANETGMRKLAMAAATIVGLGNADLSDEARDAMLNRVLDLTGQSVAELANVGAKTGIVENRVKNASERLSMQADLFELTVKDMTGVDPYEASVRVEALLQQIETSYALTARIQGLSLMNYLG